MKPCRFRCIFHLRKWRLVNGEWHVMCNRCDRFIGISYTH